MLVETDFEKPKPSSYITGLFANSDTIHLRKNAHNISGDIIIPLGKTLVIDSNKYLRIDGKLTIKGTVKIGSGTKPGFLIAKSVTVAPGGRLVMFNHASTIDINADLHL